MKKMIPAIAILVFLSVNGFAAIWTEDFTGQEGKGMSGTTALGVITNMSGITNWTVSGGGNLNGDTSLNWWQVTNGVFQGQDVGTATADWESKAIDVSVESTVTISMDLLQVGLGCNAGAEYFKIFYRLDGGAEQVLLYVSLTNQASYTGTTFNSPAIDVAAASTLNILTRININGTGDGWQFDNVQLAAGAGPTNVQFTGSSAAVTESSGSYTVTVYKSKAEGNISGEVGLSGTAAEGGGADYTIDTTNFTLNGATTSATFVVTINDDTSTEAAETIILTLANVTGGTVSAPSVFTLTIGGNDLSEPVVWFNEVNYDPTGTDAGEFFEVAGLAGTDLSAYQVVRYNGSGGVPYGTTNLSGSIDDEGCGYGAASFLWAGMQNDLEGLALAYVNAGVTSLVQFVSYEGALTGVGGPADGHTGQDIGTQNNFDNTLQLGGTATNYSGFTWETNTASAGSLNVNQAITGCSVPNPPSITITNPSASTIVDNSISSWDVQGDCNANVVGEIAWTNALSGGSGTLVAALSWSVNIPLSAGVNVITLTATNNSGQSATDSISIQRSVAGVDNGTVLAFINEVECNGLGADTNDFVEIVAPAGTNLAGCFLVHYNGADASDGEVWRVTIPDFEVPNDGITDTNGVALGFCVIAQAGAVVNVDFAMPSAGLLGSSDGIVLYDAQTNILDAVAWDGNGDLDLDDPGTVTITGFGGADNYLHVTGGDGANTDTTLQAPNEVLFASGASWTLIPETPGAINGGQTSGYIIVTTGAGPINPDSDADGMLDAWEMQYFSTLTNGAAGNNDSDPANNLEESLADTNPTNSDSYLGFVNFELYAPTPAVVATFKGGTQAVQIIEYTTNLMGGNWSFLSSNMPPTFVTNTFGISPSPRAEFFRVRAHR